jgi:AcrR family transcriptional regulator
MPKIVGQTVAENRDLRQASLLNAAAEIAHEQGIGAVTVAAVAERVGIARSSVYSYFASGADMIADILVDELITMAAHLKQATADATSEREAIELWVGAALRYIIEGRHTFVRAAANADLPPTRKAQVSGLHQAMAAPLMHALASHGEKDAVRLAQQIQSVIEVCVRRIEHGGDIDDEIEAAKRFVFNGLS